MLNDGGPQPGHVGPDFSAERYPLLDSLQLQPSRLKQLGLVQLKQLAAELRCSLMEIVRYTGGHLASNLGVVELSIALHYVFDSPRDALIWDVGHQAYVHKMLTGRWRDFHHLRQRAGLSGFPRRDESLHDYLNAGHAGTAISAGLGLELGRSLDDSKDQGKVLCVVGDASLTSGIAFEAMNHCDHQPNQLVVVMNDNEMSIAPNVGAVSRILSRLTAGHSYVFLRDHVNQLIRLIPLLGGPLYRGLLRLKGAVKQAVYRNNLFTEFGFKYIGPIDGHNIKMLIDTFQRIAKLKEPAFLHVRTQKGRGLKEAEEAPSKYHGVSPSAPSKVPAANAKQHKQNDQGPPETSGAAMLSFTESFISALLDLEAEYDELVCISAAMAGSTGLQRFAERHPQRFFDVGIAEQHALTLACGLALAGKLPLVAIYSTFMQRALDQLIHDISLMKLPALVICDRAGIVPGDGDTHQGIYDIVQFRSIIGLELYSPATQPQLRACLRRALQRSQRELAAWRLRRQSNPKASNDKANNDKEICPSKPDFCATPVVIRLPKRSCPNIALSLANDPCEWQFFSISGVAGHSVGQGVLRANSATNSRRSLLFCSGSLLPEALAVQQRLARYADLDLDVLQLCQLGSLPKATLAPYLLGQVPSRFGAGSEVVSGLRGGPEPRYIALFCIEDGVLQGGIGEALLHLQMELQIERGAGACFLPLHLRGVEDRVPQLGTYEQLLEDYGMDTESLESWIYAASASI